MPGEADPLPGAAFTRYPQFLHTGWNHSSWFTPKPQSRKPASPLPCGA